MTTECLETHIDFFYKLLSGFQNWTNLKDNLLIPYTRMAVCLTREINKIFVEYLLILKETKMHSAIPFGLNQILHIYCFQSQVHFYS